MQYRNQWHRDVREWDPAKSPFAVAFRRGTDGHYVDQAGNEHKLSLEFGCVGVPERTREKALRRLAGARARFPAVADRLILVRLPCAFCHPEDWIELEDEPDAETVAEAAAVRWDDRFSQERYERNLAKVYF